MGRVWWPVPAAVRQSARPPAGTRPACRWASAAHHHHPRQPAGGAVDCHAAHSAHWQRSGQRQSRRYDSNIVTALRIQNYYLPYNSDPAPRFWYLRSGPYRYSQLAYTTKLFYFFFSQFIRRKRIFFKFRKHWSFRTAANEYGTGSLHSTKVGLLFAWCLGGCWIAAGSWWWSGSAGGPAAGGGTWRHWPSCSDRWRCSSDHPAPGSPLTPQTPLSHCTYRIIKKYNRSRMTQQLSRKEQDGLAHLADLTSTTTPEASGLAASAHWFSRSTNFCSITHLLVILEVLVRKTFEVPVLI